MQRGPQDVGGFFVLAPPKEKKKKQKWDADKWKWCQILLCKKTSEWDVMQENALTIQRCLFMGKQKENERTSIPAE